MKIEAHVTVTASGKSAVDLLQDAAELPKQRIKFAMAQGAVWLTRGRNTQRLRRAKRALREGDELHLYYDSDILAEIPAEPTLIADLGDYSVWDKPPGLRSQGSKWGDHCTVVRWAERHLVPERSAFTVHRLDRAASGLIVVAHTKSMAASFSALFRSRKVEKRYLVSVKGDFSEHAAPLRVDQSIDGKRAVSEFVFIDRNVKADQSLLEARIETGRKHQIRRHLADLGFPVVGDRLYGDGATDDADLRLTAVLLAFRCPIAGEKVQYVLGA